MRLPGPKVAPGPVGPGAEDPPLDPDPPPPDPDPDDVELDEDATGSELVAGADCVAGGEYATG